MYIPSSCSRDHHIRVHNPNPVGVVHGVVSYKITLFFA
jgi:hypothetical protein